jgi:hypothetical protein
MERAALVEAGVSTRVDFAMKVGEAAEVVNVDGAAPQLHYDSHTVGGLVTQSQIEDLPLNGRSFLELAKLEPGVQPPVRANSNRTLVPVLGAPGGNSGRGTRVTIDGGSIMAVGNGGSAMGFSQEEVQEFQISTANFDLSTGITFTGAINVVTRSGGNDLHGAAFHFFRDHKLAANPGLSRDPANPDPFFQRRQFGLAAGGPIRRDRVFFFANWERNEQRGVADATFAGPNFSHLSGVFPSPLFGDQEGLRLDARLTQAHSAFLRYSHDGNRAFGPAALNPNAYPSSWTVQTAWADQSLLGLTSVLRANLVNDFRFSYFFISSRAVPPKEQDCPGCLGIGAPTINIQQAGLVVGGSAVTLVLGRRFHLDDAVAWQRGKHRVRFGLDLEHNRGGGGSFSNEPSMVLFSPDQVRAYDASPQTPPDLRVPLPAVFNTVTDLLQLPLLSFAVGIGDPRVPQENGGTTRTWNTARLYFQDTWRINQGLTINYGLAWNIDRDQNYDLAKPALLAPILGANGLGPTRKQWKNFSPSLGMAWVPSRGGKTVVRAGAGLFSDFMVSPNLDEERALLGPAGLGRQTILGSSVPNPLPDIPGVPLGTPLNFTGSPTLFTGADLMSIVDATRAALAQSLANPSVLGIQISKQAATVLYPANAPTWSSQQANLGVQREIARDFVVTADVVYRHFIHGWLGTNNGGLDVNHFNSVRGPVIPKCTAAQQNDPQALCSNGPILVFEPTRNATYKGLLLKADKRLSRGFPVLGSYAWSSNTGTAGSGGTTTTGLNLDNWHKDPGPLPTDYTHIANVAGVVQLPKRFELGLNFSYSSAPPLSITDRRD